jgi:hypothetical protein
MRPGAAPGSTDWVTACGAFLEALVSGSWL